MSASDLEEIKRWLDHGDQARIAEDLNVKRETVCQALSGKTKNHKVVSAALDKAIERKAGLIGKMDRLKQLQ